MAVNFHRLIYLRTYFAFSVKQDSNTNSLYLVKEDTAQPGQSSPLSAAGPNIAKTRFLCLAERSKVLRTASEQSGSAELQMWRGSRLRPHATSHRRCSRVAVAAVSTRLREGLAETRRKMHVKITCLRDALYKAFNLSVFTAVHTGYEPCMWWRKIYFSGWGVLSFVDASWSFMSDCKACEWETPTMMLSSFWKTQKFSAY